MTIQRQNGKASPKAGIRALLSIAAIAGTIGLSVATPATAEDKPFLIYEASHAWLGHPFFKVQSNGMTDAAKLYGAKVISLQETGGPPNSAQQSDRIDRAISARPDALIVSFPDAKGIEASVKRALDNGITVIGMGVCDVREGADKVPYSQCFGTDEHIGGLTAGKYLIEHKSPKNGLCINTNGGQSGLVARCNGFTDAYKSANLTVNTIIVPPDSPTQAAEQFRAYILANPELDSVFVVDPVYAIEMMKVLQEQDKIGKIALFSYDLSNDVIDAIDEGNIVGTIDQSQYLQGYMAVQFAYLNKKHGFSTANKDVAIGLGVVDKDRIESFKADVAAGIH